MARARTRTTTRTSRTRTSKGGLAKYLLPAAALGVGAYLLWPKKALAAGPVTPQIPPPAPTPPTPSGPALEPVAAAALPPGATPARVTASSLFVRETPADNGRAVSRVPQGATLAIIEAGPPSPPTPAAPRGWQKIRTPRGIDGYVSVEYIEIGQPVATAGYYRRY